MLKGVNIFDELIDRVSVRMGYQLLEIEVDDFEKESLLCHFVIIFREIYISAVVFPNALEYIKNGHIVIH